MATVKPATFYANVSELYELRDAFIKAGNHEAAAAIFALTDDWLNVNDYQKSYEVALQIIRETEGKL